MKVTIHSNGTSFVAVVDGSRSGMEYFGRSAPEALGEAVRGNVDEIPGLEISFEE